jgi:hypothetical protein
MYGLKAVPWSFYIQERVEKTKSAECASFLVVVAVCIRARIGSGRPGRNKDLGFRGRVRTQKKPQISPLRYAPVEMTILFEDRIPRFKEKYEISVATELSSRPERSVVERSAVSFLGSHTPSCKCSRRGTTREYRRVLRYLCTAQNCFRTRIGGGCAKEGLKPGFSPYPSRTAARLFLELLSTECPSVSVHQLGVDVATLWLRHGCPWSIGCRDPRSQKRDLGHPSRFSDTVG